MPMDETLAVAAVVTIIVVGKSLAAWLIVRADDKETARLAVIHDLASRLDYRNKDRELSPFDHQIVFEYDPLHPKRNKLAP